MSWTHLRDTAPKARKEYRCFLCSEPILIGKVHVYRAGIMDDNLTSIRMHMECESATADWDEMDWESTFAGDMDRPPKEGNHADPVPPP